MNTIVEELLNVPTIADTSKFPTLEYDNQIKRRGDAISLAMFDFSKKACSGWTAAGGNKTIPQTNGYMNLVDEVYGAANSTAAVIENGGLKMIAGATDVVNLTPAWLSLQATPQQAYMVNYWLKVPTGATTYASQYLSVGTTNSVSGTNGIVSLFRNSIGTAFRVYAGMSYFELNTTNMVNNALHLVSVVRITYSPTQYITRVYVDGVYAGSGTAQLFSGLAYTSTNIIGGGTNLNDGIGKVYRGHLIKLVDETQAKYEALITAEYAANYTRLKALSDLDA